MFYKQKINEIRKEWLEAIEDSIRSGTNNARIYLEFQKSQIEIETIDAGNTIEVHIWSDCREEERHLPNVKDYILNILPDWFDTENRMIADARKWELQREDLRRWIYAGSGHTY